MINKIKINVISTLLILNMFQLITINIAYSQSCIDGSNTTVLTPSAGYSSSGDWETDVVHRDGEIEGWIRVSIQDTVWGDMPTTTSKSLYITIKETQTFTNSPGCTGKYICLKGGICANHNDSALTANDLEDVAYAKAYTYASGNSLYHFGNYSHGVETETHTLEHRVNSDETSDQRIDEGSWVSDGDTDLNTPGTWGADPHYDQNRSAVEGLDSDASTGLSSCAQVYNDYYYLADAVILTRARADTLIKTTTQSCP